ncbi:MAG: bifunctional heptose 7-phosphate kinase/heptose 1-phosphate adenyltransferase [Bacteroidota bacterium]
MNKEELKQLFESFNSQKIIVIGDVMIDSYLWGSVSRISPEAPVPIMAVKKRESRLGGAANVALNLQAMGATPILCGVVGDDDKASLFEELMQLQKLNKEGIIKVKDRLTTVKFRIIGNNMHMLRVDEESENLLSSKDSQNLFDKIKILTDKHHPSAIIFEDYDKGVISKELIEKVVELAKKNNIPTCVDPKINNFKSYNNVTLFKPNLKELKEGMKLHNDLKDEKQISDASVKLQKELNIDILLTTLSEKGIFYSQKQNKDYISEIIPAHKRDISDVSGAGDTVISVAALFLAAKQTAEIIAKISNLAGGLVCEHVGVVPINKEKLFNEAVKDFLQ